jgi:uncharacterized protein with PIN domain
MKKSVFIDTNILNEKRTKWIEAGKMFAINLDSIVLCPECELSNLKATDITNENNPQEFERLLYCSNCKAKKINK